MNWDKFYKETIDKCKVPLLSREEFAKLRERILSDKEVQEKKNNRIGF